VVFAGTKLTKYGDAIAEKTRLSGAWIGLLLLATITSMPELVTGISSVTIVDVPDLAVGTVMGSNLFNLSLIVLMDVLYRDMPLLSAASRKHLASASLCILIIALAGIGIIMGNQDHGVSFGKFDLFSLLLILSYLSGLTVMSRLETGTAAIMRSGEIPKPHYSDMSLRRTGLSFTIAGIVIIGASIWLATIGDEIAETTGWEASFVGSLFLAVISSLPELTVCIAAIRLGAVDMAIADLLGSNMFNTGIIIAASDIAYRGDSILYSASLSLAWAAMIAIAMTIVVMAGILFPAKQKALRFISREGPILLGLWIAGSYILFTG